MKSSITQPLSSRKTTKKTKHNAKKRLILWMVEIITVPKKGTTAVKDLKPSYLPVSSTAVSSSSSPLGCNDVGTLRASRRFCEHFWRFLCSAQFKNALFSLHPAESQNSHAIANIIRARSIRIFNGTALGCKLYLLCSFRNIYSIAMTSIHSSHHAT